MTMKFDVVLGNPPYQDGAKPGGQNKIYNQFAKKCIDLLTPDGVVALITPVSVLKRSKRFSVLNINGLKTIDFTANDYFSEIGVSVCTWLIDKNYLGDITIIGKTKTFVVPKGVSIYNPDKHSEIFIRTYEGLKNFSTVSTNRMFKQNPVDAGIKGRSKTKTLTHQYPIYKIQDGKEQLVQYNRPAPKLFGAKKFVVSLTKTLCESSCVVSSNDFDVNHVFIDVNSDVEVLNIKSFLFSEYFIDLSNKVKHFDGYGFNNLLKYLPTFDKTRSWSNDDVRTFIESFSS